ncbi:hypothetical protein D0Z07_8739 [Hyphodiscus hymeniophilus]|uniref:Beta-lactamase-related domain-containing protein n=1 Tax=Hyphodiscus hymeniophilus TaxID=353542 RepID=A0A9P6SMW1_9HELO|nr:hypothetical protein D0Z07_8739 [Hyphodiscus hymeniophilus]
MEVFTKLESLISSQNTAVASAAAVIAEIGSPAVSIAILDHGTIASRCISTVGGDSETLFQPCSISKPITGMATMRLVQAGKLQLDSRIVELLPDHIIRILETLHTKAITSSEPTSGITISHFPGYSKDAPEIETILSGKAPTNTPQVKVEGLPGYALSYSGGGLIVLQIILEAVTGQDFPTLMKELVLDPLGMSRSYYALEEGEESISKAHFTGYTPCDAQWHATPEMAAAGLWATPTDLLKAVRAIQQSLTGDTGEEFLKKEIAMEMLKEVQNTMALTWIVPKNAFVHSGSNTPGWECFLMGYKDLAGSSGDQELSDHQKDIEDCGIAIMTNSAAGFTIWAKVFHAITYLKGWPSLPYTIGGSPVGKIPFCAYGVKIDERWIDWMGSWLDQENEFVLESNGNEPVLRYGSNVVTRLVPAAIPSIEYAERERSIDLVLEGLEMMIRLGWKDGKGGIELWYDGVPPRMLHLSRVD